MISKLELQSVINKYFLNGMVESVKWTTENNALEIDFQSPNKDMIGRVKHTNFPLEDSEIAVYDTSKLNKLFRIFKFSFSNFLKQRAKEAVKYISNYETTVVNYCKNSGYDSILCGHIHKPEITTIEGVKYYNVGDWVESNTFIVETPQGEIQLIKYEDFIRSSN